jgi:hypothetical protein
MHAPCRLRSFLKVELGVLPLGQAALSNGASEWEGSDFDKPGEQDTEPQTGRYDVHTCQDV